jgi:hypothetical protein
MANPIPKHSSCGEKTKINLSGVGKKKFKETYFVCKKQRHICKDCCHVKGKKKHKAISLRMLTRKLLRLL